MAKQKPTFGYTLGELLQQYIETAHTNQKALSELSFELAEQGILDHGLQRQHISRLVKDGVQVPEASTLHIVAVSLATAMDRYGLPASPDMLYSHLWHAAHNRPVPVENLDPELIELINGIAAVLAPLRADMRRAIYAGYRAFASAFMKRAKDEQIAARLKSRETQSNDV